MSAVKRVLRGVIRVPSDKSLSHRVALFAAMAEGTSYVRGLLDSLDVHRTLGVVKALGAKVDLLPEKKGKGLSGSITGWGQTGPLPTQLVLQCGNSGTTARLMLGVLSGHAGLAWLAGDDSLSGRPMGRVTTPLSMMGAKFSGENLPLSVQGNPRLMAIDYVSPVASAQVKSAVLLAGLSAQGTTSVREPHKSRDHTELVLPAFGVQPKVKGLTVSVEGGQQLRAADCAVPGDPSSAAFLLVAAAMLPESSVTVMDVLLNPTRLGFVDVMKRMGVQVVARMGAHGRLGAEVVGDIRARYCEDLQATTVEPQEIASLIDEVPILALLAGTAKGTTVFKQVGELRVKESDRLAAIICGLGALGIEAFAQGDDLHVVGGKLVPTGESLDACGDHRLAMTFEIGALASGVELDIIGKESVGVSYPGFFDDLQRLNGLF